ncbi:MAG TPA: hypothetical protein VKE22_06685, partial [Haliangiales bacterium]|nr:hypothetical protein [Haliangiales bacterium]
MAKREGTRRDGSVDVRKALMTPVGGGKGDWAQIAVTVPKAHLRVLETEAQLLGLRRGQLLELLFLA